MWGQCFFASTRSEWLRAQAAQVWPERWKTLRPREKSKNRELRIAPFTRSKRASGCKTKTSEGHVCCGNHVLAMAASLELFGLLALGGAIFSTRAILSSRPRVLLPGLPQLRRSFSAVFSVILLRASRRCDPACVSSSTIFER